MFFMIYYAKDMPLRNFADFAVLRDGDLFLTVELLGLESCLLLPFSFF